MADPDSSSIPGEPASGPDADPDPLPAVGRVAPGLAMLPWLPAADGELSAMFDSAGLWLLVIAGLGLAIFGAAAATSLLAHSPSLLADLLEQRRHPQRERIADDCERRGDEYLCFALLCGGLGWALAPIALCQFHDAVAGGLGLGLLLPLLAVLAAGLPIVLAKHRAEIVLLRLRPGLFFGSRLLRWPLLRPALATARLLAYLAGWRPANGTAVADVQKQVMAAVADSMPTDELQPAERRWIGNIVALKEMEVAAVMRPRPDIVALTASLSLADAVREAMQHGYSRYPVYEERLDEVIGIFHVKDALQLLQDGGREQASAPLRSMLREPLFVPETMGLAQLLQRFQKGHLHMAVVLDEYGITAGLVSVEDVLEQIVGDIDDEYDSPADAAAQDEQIDIIEEGRIIELSGRTPVADVNAALAVELPEDGDWETIAGLVIANCNRIPAVGEAVVIGNAEFLVLAADARRLQRLRVTLPQPATAEESR